MPPVVFVFVNPVMVANASRTLPLPVPPLNTSKMPSLVTLPSMSVNRGDDAVFGSVNALKLAVLGVVEPIAGGLAR